MLDRIEIEREGPSYTLDTVRELIGRQPQTEWTLILGQDHLQQFYVIGTVALWTALVTATISGVDYYRRFARIGL